MASTVQLNLKVSMNVYQRVENTVVKLLLTGRAVYKASHFSEFLHANRYYVKHNVSWSHTNSFRSLNACYYSQISV